MTEKYDPKAINASTDILALVERYIPLTKSGAEYRGTCPFHNDSDPSFYVAPQKNLCGCFPCGMHESPVGFLMAIESIPFPEACKRLLNGSGTNTGAPIPQRTTKLKRPPARKTFAPPADNQKPDMRLKSLGDPVAVWTYRTAEGDPLGYVARYQDGDKKTIRCWTYGQRSDQETPAWTCGHFAAPRPLYNAHELAARPDAQALIVEGEKTADAARRLFPALVAITWPGGCESLERADWSQLKGRKVVLLPDNDAPGIDAMHRLARLLHAQGAIEIKGITPALPGETLPQGWDVADFPPIVDTETAMAWAKERVFTYPQTQDAQAEAAASGSSHEPPHDEIPLNAYSDADTHGQYPDSPEAVETPPTPVSAKNSPLLVGIYNQQNTGPAHTAASLGVISYRGSEKQPKARDWLWRDKIACGVITGLSGDPGLGKSQITASLAAIVTVGGQWPVTRDRAPQGSVIILNCEDDFETTIAPRLIAAGADMDKIHVFEGVQTVAQNGMPSSRMFDLSQDINRLVVMMREIGDVRLVIIDPISAYVGNGKVDSHNNTDVRSVLAPLTKAAEADPVTGRQGAAILIVNHLNKDSSKSALHRTQGSVAWTAAPRCIWAVIRDKEDESGRSRLMMCVKNNIGPDTDGFRYEVEGFHLTDSDPLIETSRIMWHTEAVDSNAEQAFHGRDEAEEKSALSDAEQFLKDALRFGWVRTSELQLQARKAGVSWTTAVRAKARLRIKASRHGGLSSDGAWGWELPE